MKTINITLTIGLITVLFISSCENINDITNNDTFRIEFSDGTFITENHISFYDSSTHLLFMKVNMALNESVTDFDLLVNGSRIFEGVIHRCELSTPPPSPHYISNCFLYADDIIELGFYGESGDMRNNKEIIDAFKNNGLLRNGISMKIDNAEIITRGNHSEITCTISLKNNDNINYYVPDPDKMGDLDFNYYTGGLLLKNKETSVTYPMRWTASNPDWENITINDLSVLEAGSEISFSFECSDYNKMEPGNYSARLRYSGVIPRTHNLDTEQSNGRIWVGNIYATFENIIVE